MEYEIERRASFEKKSGILQLSPTHLVWTADSAADGRDLRIPFTAVKGYQVSKAGGKKVRAIAIHALQVSGLLYVPQVPTDFVDLFLWLPGNDQAIVHGPSQRCHA